MRIRPTARLIVLDDQDRLLLFKFEDHAVRDPYHPLGDEQPRIFWATPGGGLEEGETFDDAVHRELFEETGLRDAHLGECLLERDKELHINGEPVLFRERYFLARVPPDAVVLDGLSDLERAVYRDHRWWPIDELVTTDEIVYPEDLARLLAGRKA